MKSKVMLDRAIALFLLVVCGFLYHVAGEYPAGGDYFPRFSLGVIMLMAALMLGLSFRPGKTPEEREELSVKKKNLRPLILIGIFFLYLLVYPRLGFYVSTALFALAVMAFLQVRRPVLYLTVIPGLALVFYGFFGLILKVPFPDGWLI
jgi:hypothetical protein